MIKYPKIKTLFERDPNTFKVNETLKVLKEPEFGLFNEWEVSEKIDGTNIRVEWIPEGSAASGIVALPHVKIGGRTDNAQIPSALLYVLQEMFPDSAFRKQFDDDAVVTLFGEGYGGKIQRGGAYRLDPSFMLFDIHIGPRGHQGIWLSQDAVDDVA